MKITGWPAGMLQDDCSGLSKWLASRLGARRQVDEMYTSEKISENQVVAFKTTDGKLYATKREAEIEQHIIDLEEEIKAFAKDTGGSYYSIVYGTAITKWERFKKEKELCSTS